MSRSPITVGVSDLDENDFTENLGRNRILRLTGPRLAAFGRVYLGEPDLHRHLFHENGDCVSVCDPDGE
jgi:hypothetical protein